MATEDTQFQLVTFQLGDELYGVNIMDVKEIDRYIWPIIKKKPLISLSISDIKIS